MAADTPEEHPIVLFDGVCNLCTGAVQFIIRHDPEGRFRFAPLQSQVGEQLAEECGVPTDELETMVVIDDGECYTRSDAALRIAHHLGGVYRLLSPLGVLPKRVRDVVYNLVAEHRYTVFGQRDQCMVPTPDIRSRFLAGGPDSDPTPVETDGETAADD